MQRALKLLTGHLAPLDDTVQIPVWAPHQLGVGELASTDTVQMGHPEPLRQTSQWCWVSQ